MSLRDILKKQGGIELLYRYWLGGALFTAVGQFVLLGKSRTALEILRLSAQFKIKKKLFLTYNDELKKFDDSYIENIHEKSDKVWFCWLQGIEVAPEIVKKCYSSLMHNLSQKDIVVITSDNLTEYVDFPDYIIEKWKKKIITDTHMTDLLRLELLIKYGGMWLDATVLCTSKEEEIPDYFFNSDLFFFQCLKPGRDGHSTYISSWLMSASTNNKILMATRHLCYEYWKKNSRMVDYFLLHDFLSIVLDYYPEEWKKIIPCDNATPHLLLLRLFDVYDEKMWCAIKNQTPFHKLSYKFSEEQREKKETYYRYIVKDNI